MFRLWSLQLGFMFGSLKGAGSVFQIRAEASELVRIGFGSYLYLTC